MSTLLLLKVWILSLLVATGDPGAPWKDTYDTTAMAFAEGAQVSPLFCTKQPDGECVAQPEDVRKTGALYVSTSWFESRHNPKAEGDGTCLEWSESADKAGKARCLRRGPAHSFCLGQINDSNFPGLGITKEAILGDVRVCVKAMNTLMRKSLKVCAAEPIEFGLSWYAAGGDGCRPNKESQHRVNKAKWLFSNKPFGDKAALSAR
jgi:hypothetical protein